MATITAAATVSQVITKAASATTATSTGGNRAAPQGGILESPPGNPTHYNPKDPIITFIIQAGIIIIFCRLLHYPLSRLRQPRVIAEVIGGILLGPSVMGRIPGFTNTIFPSAAMPNLTLVANIGLVLFLFLVGLEVDLRYLISNWKVAASVGLAGMILPFGFGCAIAWGLYHQFKDEPGTVPISFGVFMLFIGVAMAITAFPVLCRILTELKLLGTSVGVIVLSAGVGNDVVGWILLALCVALVNANSGLTALWVLLVCVGYILFLVYAVRPVFLWVLRRNRSIQDGPSQGIVALTLMICLASAFFTGVIGVHPIFGAFLAGLICPHEGGFAIKLTEKVEDLVSAIFLPLYFTLSGLNTNLGLLDSGITWGYVIGVIAVAFFAKFIGAAVAARLSGMVWRESFTIGSLMSCKGLVELIVLNIGLQAKILSSRTFTIFVVMALVTTFATTPLTSAFYPPWYQKKIEAWRRGEIDWDTGAPISEHDDGTPRDSLAFEKLENVKVQRLLVYLRLDNMPPILAFMSLLGRQSQATQKTHPTLETETVPGPEGPSATNAPKSQPVAAHGVRLLELTDRDSSVMKVSEVDVYSVHDPIVNTFRTFGSLHNLAVSGEVTVLPQSSFAETLVHKASDTASDLILLPWSATGSISEAGIISQDNVKSKLQSSTYVNFVQAAFENATCSVAVFLNKNFGGTGETIRPKLSRSLSALSIRSGRDLPKAPVKDLSHHIYFPYFGGPDDRVALRFVLQLAENPDVTATLVHFETPSGYFEDEIFPTTTPGTTTPTNKQVESAVAPVEPSSAERHAAFFSSLKTSIPESLSSRVVFETFATTSPLSAAIERAGKELGQNPKNAGDLMVVGRNDRLRTAFLKDRGSTALEDGEAASVRCIGVVGDRAANANLGGSILVLQARPA